MHSMLFFIFLLCSFSLQTMPKKLDCSKYLKMSESRLKIISDDCKDEKNLAMISSIQPGRIDQIKTLLQCYSKLQEQKNKMKDLDKDWQKEDALLSKRLRQQPSCSSRSSSIPLDAEILHKVTEDLEALKSQNDARKGRQEAVQAQSVPFRVQNPLQQPLLQTSTQTVAMTHCQVTQEHTQGGQVRPRKGTLSLNIDTLLEQSEKREIPAQVQLESARQVEESKDFVSQGLLQESSVEVLGSKIESKESLTLFELAQKYDEARDFLYFACNYQDSRPCKVSRAD